MALSQKHKGPGNAGLRVQPPSLQSNRITNMFIEDDNWNDEPDSQAPSNAVVNSIQKDSSLANIKGVGRKSLLRTLQTLGSVPDMKSDAPQEDSDSEKEAVPSHTKRKKKRSKRQKQAGASEKEAENGVSILAEKEKIAPKKLKNKKELKSVKKVDSDNGEEQPKSAELKEQNGEITNKLSRKQWKNKMKNKKKCKNKFLQNKPEKNLNKADTVGQHVTDETKPGGLHCNSSKNTVTRTSVLKKDNEHKPKKRKKAEEDRVSSTPDMQTSIEDQPLTRKEMKNKQSNQVKKGAFDSKQETGKESESKEEHPTPSKIRKLEISKVERQKREKLRKLLSRQEPEQENHKAHEDEDMVPHLEQEVQEPLPDRSSALRSRMVQRLESARFRYINEVLYTTSSGEAKRLFKEDPNAFEIYHKGFTAQVQKWPSNPVDAIISYIQRKPSSLVVADFGCGDCKIAQCVKNKVHSFDLAPVCDLVTVCDMANVPLDDDTVDIAVFCLSLMGTNLADFLAEANRVLVMGGVLKIAEVASRFENLRSFLTALASLGFKLSSKDTENSHFFSFEFVKTGDASGNVKKLGLQLNPCLYKKR